ncbi:hypothetical protein T265_14756, partial [Opisthorchis viverrini]
YTSLVSTISEQLDRAYCSRSREINPWLLLGLNQSDEFSRSMELAAQDLPLRQTSSAECDWCHAMDERNNQSQDIGFDPVDLEVLVKKLHQHRLLETLRPTHLLTPLPLGLATVILQHHLGVTKKSSLPSDSLLSSSAHLPNNSPLLGLDAVDPIQFYHWAPLLTTSMMLLRHSSSTTPTKSSDLVVVVGGISIKEQPTTLHPILSLKLGNGPLSVLPPSSPAQVSPRNAWLSMTQSVNHVVSLRRFRVPCYCRWAISPDPKDNVKRSGSDSNSPKLASNLQPDRSPRLFYPFFNEVRNAWLSMTQSVNHVVSLRRFRVPCYCRWAISPDPKDNVKRSGSDSNSPKLASNLQPDRSPRLFYPFFNEVRVILTSRSLSSTPVRNPPIGHESRCTCLRLLSTLSAQCTPTHVPLTAIQRNDSFPVSNGYNHQQTVSNCEATITVSPQKAGHGDTESVTTTRDPCCNSKCADFAHCLLQPHQWTDLISRYLQLVEEFAKIRMLVKYNLFSSLRRDVCGYHLQVFWCHSVRAGEEIQQKLSVRADREAWWTRKVEEMKDAKNAGNVRKLFHLIRSTGPRKPLVSEVIRGKNGSKAERLDRWAQYFEQQFSWPSATSTPETWPSTERWTVNMEPPLVSELSECISLLKRHRAAGPDDLSTCSFQGWRWIPQPLPSSSRHSNPWIRLDANHVCLLYRLQVLREQGLPDDLHTLLACRINERLCELSPDVADLSSEVGVDRKTLDIISSTVSASKHAGINLSHFSTRSYGSADASSFSITTEKETSPLVPEDAASVSVTTREKHSRRVNTSLHPYIETKNEAAESHKCLACQTAGQPITLLDYPAGSRHPLPKPRSSPSARITQPNTTSHGGQKNSNSTLPCLCDNLPYPTYTLPGFGGKQRRINKYPDDNLCSIPRSIHRSRRQKRITKPISTPPLLLVPLGRTHQSLRGSANTKHELANRKQKARHIRGVSFEDVPVPRCSCPHFLPTETEQNLSFKKYPVVCSTEFRRERSRFYPEPHYFTMLYCHSNNRRSPLPPIGFPSHLSSSCSYRSSSDFSGFSKSTSDLSDTLSLGDYSITLDATD